MRAAWTAASYRQIAPGLRSASVLKRGLKFAQVSWGQSSRENMPWIALPEDFNPDTDSSQMQFKVPGSVWSWILRPYRLRQRPNARH